MREYLVNANSVVIFFNDFLKLSLLVLESKVEIIVSRRGGARVDKKNEIYTRV